MEHFQKIINIAVLKNHSKDTIKVRNLQPGYLASTGLILFAGILIALTSCRSGSWTATDETPTRGNISIVVDESFQPLIDSEIYTFTSLYRNAKVTPKYKPEYDVVNDFMNDSVKVMVTTRPLTENQIQYLRDTLVVARTTRFAHDALALITNLENTDTLINYETVRDIFKGRISSWKEINPKSKLSGIRVIFDNNKSGNIRYFRELFQIEGNLGPNFFAVNNNPEVIDFVSRNKDALGIISANWISDRNDSLSMSFIRKIHVLAISQQFVNDGSYYRPYQGSIFDKSYPFVREVYLISRETFAGLGTGFIQWATGEQGQRIVLKSGLVPATMPIRLVQIRN
ncbi:MAG TPA: substrate-binding domain-containing protein [Bacteroidales bacterium]|jgi:phosphate transport system substrate-binding protein|nr:phosphate ABC transporter substrate-binding protein, PhoT family [Bacteroidales bacterium]HNR42877.1 substrate-binding domain-containing protein [Bacteroidales bacterium]HQG77472.1 substrate-binding domain-containing protein [Bacteroidales bacterium]